jgi:hypothetical protein
MRRLLNPEVALGFLLATLLWIGVLGWQASYAPTDSEKRQCEESAAKTGHKAEECKTLWERTTSDPVAFFTFWLVVFTGGLGGCTIMLWLAGERQLRHAETTAKRQLRSYVMSEGTDVKGGLTAAEPEFVVTIKNSGQTPAYKVKSWVCLVISHDLSVPQTFKRPDGFPQAVSVVAPGGDFRLSARSPRAFTHTELDGLTKGTVAIYVFGEVAYNDVFGEGHTTQYRYMCGSFVGVSRDDRLFHCLEGNEGD